MNRLGAIIVVLFWVWAVLSVDLIVRADKSFVFKWAYALIVYFGI